MISKVVSSLIRPQQFRTFCAAVDFTGVKINEFHKLNTFEYNDLVNALTFAENTEQMALAIKSGAPLMTEKQLAFALLRMAERRFPLTESFETIILPFIKAYTAQYTRDHAESLAESMIYVGQLGVKDQEFWDLAKKKLIDERLERYVPIHHLGDLLKALDKVDQADAKVLKALGGQVMKHKAALPKEDITSAIKALETAGKASQNIRQALQDFNDAQEEEINPKSLA